MADFQKVPNPEYQGGAYKMKTVDDPPYQEVAESVGWDVDRKRWLGRRSMWWMPFLESGDLYVADRNTGPEILTVDRISDAGVVFPTCDAYPYDLWECWRLKEV